MSPARMDRLEAGVRTVIAFIEAVNRHDPDSLMALLSEDCIFESGTPAPDGKRYAGKPAIYAYFQDFFSKSPRAQIKIEEAFGFGYRCIARWRMDWTGAVGEEGHMYGADIYRVQDGLIREILSFIKG